MFPAFQIRRERPGAGYSYPLLYAERERGQEMIERLRGMDYSSIPDRYGAMLSSAGLDAPVATRPHASADESATAGRSPGDAW